MRPSLLLLTQAVIFFLITTHLTGQSSEWIIKGYSTSLGNHSTFEDKLEVTVKRFKIINDRRSISKIEFSKELTKEYLSYHFPQYSFYQDRKLEKRSNTPDDPFYANQWALDNINLPSAWSETIGGLDASGREIVVAVIDDGFDYNHQDIQGQLYTNNLEVPNNGLDDDNNGYIDDYLGYNFISDLGDNHDLIKKHGTAVMGIIGAKGNNNIGISGVNWNVKIMLISADLVSQIIESLEYIYQMRQKYNETNGAEGAYILVTSFSGGLSAPASDYPDWCNSYDDLGELGILSVGAVPNANVDTDSSDDMPTDCTSDFTIMTTNTNIANVKVSGAGFGATTVDIGAPGENIYSLKPGNNYREEFTGTSASCPHVAGAVALLYSAICSSFPEKIDTDPSGTALAIKDILLNGVSKIPSLENRTVSGGKLDVYQSLLGLTSGICDFKLKGLNIFTNSQNIVDNVGMLEFYYTTNRSEEHEIIIHDATGRIFLRIKDNPSVFLNNTIALDGSNLSNIYQDLPKGMYFISVYNEEEVKTQRFIKI